MWAYIAPVVFLDLGARLAVPASLFAFARGHGDAAIVAAAAVNVLSILRGILGGIVTERVLLKRWGEMIAATRRYDVAQLGARGNMHSVAALLDAVASRAAFESVTLPQLIANGFGLVLVLGVVVYRLGSSWLLVGVAAAILAAPAIFVGHRRLRRAQTRSFDRFNDAAMGFEVLLAAATELRVHGVEDRVARRLLGHVGEMAAAERKARATSAFLGLLPVGVALLVALVPLRDRLDAIGGPAAQVAEIGILGATAFAIALGLLRNLESYARTTPFRRTARQFVERAPAPRAEGTHLIDLKRDAVRLEGLTFIYEDAGAATPRAVTHTWAAERGLSLTGANGAGKTTLALCLIGVLRPTGGRLFWGDVEAADVDWGALRARVAYVPQNGYVAATRSVGWHLRLFAHGPVDDVEAQRALEAVGLWEVLARHRGSEAPLDVPAAELSGGERKRMHLARALIGDPDLVVLDEPEAGLDEESRGWLRELIDDIARARRVLLIAHDRSVVPTTFDSIVCVRGDG